MNVETLQAAEDFLFASYLKAKPRLRGRDQRTRQPELTGRLLEALGQPEQGIGCLLIAGSKGKGSTAAFAARILGSSGQKVGLFSSPHLLDVRERVRVDGRAIPPESFVRHVNEVAEAASSLERDVPEGRYFSPIGLLLCVALLHFRASGVTTAVVEAGRGARFDDTALVQHSVAAITRLMREHVRELGPALADIAWHKAGAIPFNGAAVTAPQHPRAMAILEAEALSRNSRLLAVGREVKVRHRDDGSVDVKTPTRLYAGLRPPLLGAHEKENLALAIGATEVFWPGLVGEPISTIQQLVAQVRWPGRCEILQRGPLVIVDGAVNAASARAFLRAARPISPEPIVAIVGVPSDKDYSGVYRALGPHVERLYVTGASNPYLTFPPGAATVAAQYARAVVEAPTLAEAVDSALQHVRQAGTVWIVGTQSLVADALRLWSRDLEEL